MYSHKPFLKLLVPICKPTNQLLFRPHRLNVSATMAMVLYLEDSASSGCLSIVPKRCSQAVNADCCDTHGLWVADSAQSAFYCMHRGRWVAHLEASCFPEAQGVDEGALPHLLSFPYESSLPSCPHTIKAPEPINRPMHNIHHALTHCIKCCLAGGRHILNARCATISCTIMVCLNSLDAASKMAVACAVALP